jgi:hypothetical protein
VLLGGEFDAEQNAAAFTIAGLCMNADGKIPDDRRVQVILRSVSRICASLRNGRWDDKIAEVVPFPCDSLLSVIQEFKGLPIYGHNFFDCGGEGFAKWKDRLSFDYKVNGASTEGCHTLDVFQSGDERILDIRIWFNDIQFFTAEGIEITAAEFVAAAKRAWDAIMLEGNREVQNYFCIYPAGDAK